MKASLTLNSTLPNKNSDYFASSLHQTTRPSSARLSLSYLENFLTKLLRTPGATMSHFLRRSEFSMGARSLFEVTFGRFFTLLASKMI